MSRELTQFKPGNEGGPGRPKLSEAEKEARAEARAQIAVFPMLACLTVTDLQERLKQPDTPGYEALMIAAILHGIKKGDLTEVHRFYERLLGKTKQMPDVEPPKRVSLAEEGRMIWAEYWEANREVPPIQEVVVEPEPAPEDPAAPDEPGVDSGDTPSPE